MKYINIIRRITLINKAIDRVPDAEAYDNIANRLFDKKDILVKSLKDYIKCLDMTDKEQRRTSAVKRRQLKLACRLLNSDYYSIIK